MGRDMHQQYNSEENLAKASQHYSQQASEDAFKLANHESLYTDNSKYLNTSDLTENDTTQIGGFSIWFWVGVLAFCAVVIAIVLNFKELQGLASLGKEKVKNLFGLGKENPQPPVD